MLRFECIECYLEGKKCLIIFGQNFEIQMTVDSESAVAHCTPVVFTDWVEKHGCSYVQKKSCAKLE